MEGDGEGKVSVRYRCVYLLVFLFVALPVLAGVLSWHLSGCEPENLESGYPNASTTGMRRTTTPPTTAAHHLQPWDDFRLPAYIVPLHYDLTLYPEFIGNSRSFSGNMSVEFNVTASTRYILVHYNRLTISETTLSLKSEEIGIKRTFSHLDNEFWVVETETVIPTDQTLSMKMAFKGPLTEFSIGFYKTTYINSMTNQTRYLAGSKFQPTYARWAFPCFDEPHLKAEFTISLIHPPEYTPLSNMPNESTVVWNEDLLLTKFQRSPRMSTYLVCFIVCDFSSRELISPFQVPLRVFAAPDKINQTPYALNVLNFTVNYCQRLLNVAYLLPKLDMIALPNHWSGAMEHWGLITYRECDMLYDEKEASAANKQKVATIVAHEISHMWFGNLITTAWWDDIWLNEGFATFMSYVVVDALHPSWKRMAQFQENLMDVLMTTDAKLSSQPIITEVCTRGAIAETFDLISYYKGAAVLRMLHSIIGNDRFFKGMEIYIKRHQWETVTTEDLWQALEEVPGVPRLGLIMDTWIRQMGFPVITVSFDTANPTLMTLRQDRFLSNPEANRTFPASPYNYKWYVPLDYITSANVSRVTMWLNKTVVTVDSPINANKFREWIKFNARQKSFYRVNYPDEMWKRLSEQMRDNTDNKLSPEDRSGLLDDAFKLAGAGLLDYNISLDMTLYLDQERDYLPWKTVDSNLAYISRMFESNPANGLLRKYINSKTSPLMAALGWNDTGSHLVKKTRKVIIKLACYYGNVECLQMASAKFREWIRTGASIPPNLRLLVYLYGMQTGRTENDWDVVWGRYLTENVSQKRNDLLVALAQTKTPWLLKRYLSYITDGSKIRSQDFYHAIGSIAGHEIGRKFAWNWIRENWEASNLRYMIDQPDESLMSHITSSFNTEFQLDQVLQFYEKHTEDGYHRKKVVEGIKNNIKWRKTYQHVIITWLEKNTPTL